MLRSCWRELFSQSAWHGESSAERETVMVAVDTSHALAQWTGRTGDAAWARDHMATLLPVCERVLGPEHPDTLTIRHDLAYWAAETDDAG
jgi:hypothetical protein